MSKAALLPLLTMLLVPSVWACSASSSDGSSPATPAPGTTPAAQTDAGAGAATGCPAFSHPKEGEDGCETKLEWADLKTGPTKRDHHATFLFGGDEAAAATLFVTGGVDETAGAARKDLWYAQATAEGSLEAWKKGPPPPVWQSGHGAAVVGRRAYLVSGKTVDNGKAVETPVVTSLEITAEGTPGAWRAERPLPAPRFHGTANAVGSTLLVVGGIELQPGKGATTVYRTTVASDGALSEWSEAPALPEPRSHHTTFVHGGHVFVLGGIDGSGMGFDSQAYADYLVAKIGESDSIGEWRKVKLPFFISTHSATVVGDFVYLFGGFDENFELVSTVRRARIGADGTLGDWESVGTLPLARAHVHHTPAWRSFVFSVAGNVGDHVPTDRVVRAKIF